LTLPFKLGYFFIFNIDKCTDNVLNVCARENVHLQVL